MTASCPRVSLVVTCHNYGRYLAQALDSLVVQTLPSWEAIVIDDASRDETEEVLERYSAEDRIRVVRHSRNLGNIFSYNEGLELALGEFVGVLSADDFVLRPDALERQVTIFDRHPQVGLVYSAHAILQEGSPLRYVVPWPQDGVHDGLDEFRRLMWGNYILHSGALLRRSVERELGPYEPTLTHTGDWDMWLRATARYDVGYVSEPLYAYRLHDSNMFHRGLTPRQEMEQAAATVERAFARLPGDAPADLVASRPAVRTHALLQTAWFDLYNGRRVRTWQGALHALGRRPRILADREFWRFVPRLALMTVVGREPYRRITDRLEATRRGGPGGSEAKIPS